MLVAHFLLLLFSEPDNIETEPCVSSGHDDGLWSSNNCAQDKSFACNFKSSKNKFMN